ncbi:hypothetical protein C0416_02095 [bacterium]|nr:hypothetical protein [bacterium]
MNNNKTIQITVDNYFSKDIVDGLNAIIKEAGFVPEFSRGDTSAKGGLFWFPVDVIIFATGVVLTGFLAQIGAKLADKLIDVIKKVSKDKNRSKFYIDTVLSNKVEVYFDFDIYDYKNQVFVEDKALFVKAFQEMPKSLLQLETALNPSTLALLGNPKSVVLKYDFELGRWLIFQCNSDASIFYIEMGDRR